MQLDHLATSPLVVAMVLGLKVKDVPCPELPESLNDTTVFCALVSYVACIYAELAALKTVGASKVMSVPLTVPQLSYHSYYFLDLCKL